MPSKNEKIDRVKHQIRLVLQKYDDEKLSRRLDQQTDEKHLDKKQRRRALDAAGKMTDAAIEDLAETIVNGGVAQ